MSFRHFSALRILKGRFGFRPKKCLFSDTSASAPVHSTYAAIKASASFNPIFSYFTPNSKGIEKSSSIAVKILMNLTKLLKSFVGKLERTSSTIVRHIEIECNDMFSIKYCMSDSQLAFLKRPRAKIYSLASRTKCKFFLPQLFPCFAQLFDNFFFTHTLKWRWSFGYVFTQFVPQLLSFCRFIFHKLAPLSHFASIISKFNHTGDFLSNFGTHRLAAFKSYFQEGLS